MEKTIKIKIDKKGKLMGTVGWLLENADHVKIGQTKQGKQGAWLKGKKNKTLSCLAVRDWHDDGKIAIIENWDYNEYALCPDFIVSNACLVKLRELAEEAAKTMENIWDDNPDCDLKLIIEK